MGKLRNRAEVIRTAAATWMAERKPRQLDKEYQQAYRESSQERDEVDSGRGTAEAPHPWDELEW